MDNIRKIMSKMFATSKTQPKCFLLGYRAKQMLNKEVYLEHGVPLNENELIGVTSFMNCATYTVLELSADAIILI